VRFIDTVIGRPTIVSGLSSGGVLSAWLSAYAKPGQVVAAVYEDPPLFSSEVRPAVAPGIRQGIGAIFDLWSTYLGDQWSVGAWDAMRERHRRGSRGSWPRCPFRRDPHRISRGTTPSGRAFWTGTVAAACDHERMLQSVKVPVLLTHHLRVVDEATGMLMGAMTDQQAKRVQDLLTAAGVPVEYRSFPTMGHAMHDQDPQRYVDTVLEWVASLDV
jgi:pimeloyl-ACP methyl ester carboxylesterase